VAAGLLRYQAATSTGRRHACSQHLRQLLPQKDFVVSYKE
jgi:hypothetical protein